MTRPGRPPKVLSNSDLDELYLFLQNLPFLKKHQEVSLGLLQRAKRNFDEAEIRTLKIADREKLLFQQRLALLEQIKLKEKNQQKLLENEVEILALEMNKQEREGFFRLDRALESYMKIQKAVLNDRIRLENERRSDVLKKSKQSITEAQKRRNKENKRKYELGGAVLALFKELNVDIQLKTAEEIKLILLNHLNFDADVRNTILFKQILDFLDIGLTPEFLFIQVVNSLAEFNRSGKKVADFEINKLLAEGRLE